MAFTRASEDDDWIGAVALHGKSYRLLIRASYESDELQEIANRTQEYLEANWQPILDRMVSDLLEMYNDSWSDGDATPLSAASFLAALGTPDVNVWEEEVIVLYFPDGGLFSGHYIEVFIESPDHGREITVGVVG